MKGQKKIEKEKRKKVHVKVWWRMFQVEAEFFSRKFLGIHILVEFWETTKYCYFVINEYTHLFVLGDANDGIDLWKMVVLKPASNIE